MVIQIDGASSTNKGAELMLHACLLEIQSKYPNAKVYINSNNLNVKQLSERYQLNINKRQSNSWRRFVEKVKLSAIFNKILPNVSWIFSLKVPCKGVDLLLNIGGFQFGDQWHHNRIGNSDWLRYLSKMKAYGTKIVFMPQAFGPFESKESQGICKILDTFADILIARDAISMDYLQRQGLSKTKIIEFPDFTSSVVGRKSENNNLQGRVCFIPNSKMIAQGIVDESKYINAFAKMIKHVATEGKQSFLLNHEGHGDLLLCKKIKLKLTIDVPIIEKTDALSIKGVIADSYMVVSSRFHGVANALNSSVPCLATSWSHKYQMLFKSYGFDNNILELSNFEDVKNKLDSYLNAETNAQVRQCLNESVSNIRRINKSMWNYIWENLRNEIS